MNPTETGPAKESSPCRRRYLRKLGLTVDCRIKKLQKGILQDNAGARATLAKLRQGVNADPGAIPDIWDYTYVDVPDGAPDAPTREEMAVHIAMTLYAVHQQSRSGPMHKPGFGFGRAARALVGGEGENPSARGRFNALVTASTIAELRSHLRSFIQLLRSKEEGIGFDYAAFAEDLLAFQNPGGDKTVRLRWSRDFYNFQASDGEDSSSVNGRDSADGGRSLSAE